MAPKRDPGTNPADGPVFWKTMRADSKTGIAYYFGGIGNPDVGDIPLNHLSSRQPSVKELIDVVEPQAQRTALIDVYKHQSDTQPVSNGETIDLDQYGLTMADPLLFVDRNPTAQALAQTSQDMYNGTGIFAPDPNDPNDGAKAADGNVGKDGGTSADKAAGGVDGNDGGEPPSRFISHS
ncbi:hypothetical protein B0H12DRAFT_1155615 [Mycena haematopus]|nr:hypothetical protein B0H12DRAFT_1155615 [Mycena haematopus]